MPELKCISLPNHYVTLSLLNVRSIIAKLPDILQDNSLKHASILCFCETWLTPSQQTPIVQNNQVAMRCDRASGDNKGGTMISVPQYMQPCHSQRFASNGIEVVVTILSLSNAKSLQLALLYRRPSVQMQQLLTRVLNYVSMSNTPTVILGDFNDNVLEQLESPVVSLMSIHGYAQLVNSPTTAKGTLIDHVTIQMAVK